MNYLPVKVLMKRSAKNSDIKKREFLFFNSAIELQINPKECLVLRIFIKYFFLLRQFPIVLSAETSS